MPQKLIGFAAALLAFGATGAAAHQAAPARVTPLAKPVFMIPGGDGRSLLDVVSRIDVQNEIRLTLRQRNAVGELTQSKGGPVRVTARVDSSTPGETPEEQIKKQLDSQYGGIEGRLKELLKPDQFNRLLELDAQFRGPIALGDRRVADRAQLSAAHNREIAQIVTDYQRRRMQIIFEHSQVNSQGEGSGRVAMRVQAPDLNNPLAPVRKKLDPLRKETEDKILTLLDAGEKERWSALQGLKFTFRADDPKGSHSRF